MKIVFDSVRKIYRTKKRVIHAVQPLSWTIESGSVYGIIGPNGSGKTSMIRMLLDLIRPDAGVISVDGIPRGNRGLHFRRHLGYLPEERGLYKDMNALSLLSYLAQLKGMNKTHARKKAHELLEEIGLGEVKDSPMKSFSKGMSQKVQLLSAFIHEPELLVLDEPFTGLDPVNVKLVRSFIEKRRSSGAVILLCTHLMDEAERLCDHILMMSKGRVLHSGTQLEIRKNHGAPHISISTEESLDAFSCVESVFKEGTTQTVQLKENVSIDSFIAELHELTIPFSRLEITPAKLEDIFVQSVHHES